MHQFLPFKTPDFRGSRITCKTGRVVSLEPGAREKTVSYVNKTASSESGRKAGVTPPIIFFRNFLEFASGGLGKKLL
jgi:hypothetical protein